MQEALASHKEYLARLPRGELAAVFEYLETHTETPALKQALDASPGFPESAELYGVTAMARTWKSDHVTIVSRSKPTVTRRDAAAGVRTCIVRTCTGLCVESVAPEPYSREVLLSPGVFTVAGISDGQVFVSFVQDLVELTR